MPSYRSYDKPSKWLPSGTARSQFVADRIFDALLTSAANVSNFHQFVFNDDVVTKEAGGPVNIVLQALKPWPGLAYLKVNTNRPFAVILYDEKTLKPSGQLKHPPEYFEVAFFDGGPRQRSFLRTDLMAIHELTGDLTATIIDLNSDYALSDQWTLTDLAEEAKKEQSMSESSLGEWEQGYIIGEALEWTEIELQPFANWLILPPTLQDPELQAQCEHEWREASIPIDVGLANISGIVVAPTKEIWVCEECDLMVDENPNPDPSNIDVAKKIKKVLEKIDEDVAKKRKINVPYDSPWSEPWKDVDPWKPSQPNPYAPYRPSKDGEEGWDKWVKYNQWMGKYCSDCDYKDYPGAYQAGASA